MKPGTIAICNGCRHQARDMADQGHPNPCGRQFWDGPALHKPEISAAGCNEFEPRPAESGSDDHAVVSPEIAAEAVAVLPTELQN